MTTGKKSTHWTVLQNAGLTTIERCKQYIKCRFYLFHCVFIYVLKCKPTFIFSENKDKFILGYSLNNVILDCLEDERDSFLT